MNIKDGTNEADRILGWQDLCSYLEDMLREMMG